MAATCATAGLAALASAVLPGSALAATGHRDGAAPEPTDPDRVAVRHHGRPHERLMTSGERQYRNGCRLGYISEDCEQFSVTSLLRRGIDPYL